MTWISWFLKKFWKLRTGKYLQRKFGKHNKIITLYNIYISLIINKIIQHNKNVLYNLYCNEK